MKLVMVHPKISQHSPNRLTPLSILFAGAHYEAQGHEVEYFDMRFDDPNEFNKAMKNADMLGVTSMSGSQLHHAIEIMKFAKRMNPNIKTILGGPHTKMTKEQCLKEDYIDEVETKDIGLEHFPFNKKTERFFKPPFMPIWFTSTGCPHNCGFCCIESIWKPKPMDKVIEELSIIHDKVKFKRIDICDTNIGKRSDRIRTLGKFMVDYDSEYHANIRCDYINREIASALDDGNCRSLELGCESGSERILKDIIRKGHGVEAIKIASKNLIQSAIYPMYAFIVNTPTETKEDTIKTMELIDWIIAKHPKARCSMYSYIPYPGTFMLELAKKHQLYKEPTSIDEWSKADTMSKHPLYWICGLCFRKENTARNFPGTKRSIIAPYEKLAEEAWKKRKWDDFPADKVEQLIKEVENG